MQIIIIEQNVTKREEENVVKSIIAGKAASIVGNLILDQISNFIGCKKTSIVSRYKTNKLKKEIQRWSIEYFRKHDGSILVSGGFISFFENGDIINKILAYSLSVDVSGTESDFISSLVRISIQGMDAGISAKDQYIIREFYYDILIQFNKHWISELNDEQKQQIHKNSVQHAESMKVIGDIDDNVKRILNSRAASISEKDALEIYRILNSFFWEGDFTKLSNLSPCIEGRNNSLEQWIKYVLSIAMASSSVDIPDLAGIQIKKLWEDCVRKKILFEYLAGNKITCKTENINSTLASMIDNLNDSDDGFIFERKIEYKNHTDLVAISIPETYKNEMWVAKRLLAIYIFKQPQGNRFELTTNLLEKDTDYLMDLLCNIEHLEEISIGSSIDKTLAKEVFENLWGKKELYRKANLTIQRLFLGACLRYAIQYDKGLIQTVHKLIPNELQDNDEIVELIQIGEIKLGKANFFNLMELCKKSGQYSLLYYYLISINDSYEAVKIIEENASVLLDDITIFFLYIRSLLDCNKIDEARNLLEENRNKYEDYYEYWEERCNIDSQGSNLDRLEELWMNGEGKALNPSIYPSIMNLFYKNKRFDACIDIIMAMEMMGPCIPYFYKIKSSCFLAKGKKLEALKILLRLFDEGECDSFVLGNAVAISLELKREIPEGIEEALQKSEEAYNSLLLAKIRERDGKKEEAKTAYRKALMLEHDENSIIYGNYWLFQIEEGGSRKETITTVLEETMVVLVAPGKETLTYCICAKGFLIKEYYLWHGAVFISKEKAIQLNIFIKKKGERVWINSIEYTISEIKPIEHFFSRVCLSIMINSGGAKALTMSVDNNNNPDLSELKSALKESMGDVSEHNSFEEYRNIKSIPMTLHGIVSSSRYSAHETVATVIQDKDTIIREEYDFEVSRHFDHQTKYVLSYSVTELLFMLGIDAGYLQKLNVYIPRSMVIALSEEKEAVVKENEGDRNGSIGLVDDQIFYEKPGEEIKAAKMKFAVDFYEFCSKLKQADNLDELEFETVTESDLITVYGIVDYDAVCLAHKNGAVLVSMDLMLSSISKVQSINYEVCSVLELLNCIIKDTNSLIAYMTKLVSYRMINVINSEVLKRVITDNQEGIINNWRTYLAEIDKTHGEYRDLLRTELTLAGKRIFTEDADETNEKKLLFLSFLIKFNSFNKEYIINEDAIE